MKGKGGTGNRRGCRVLHFDQNKLVVEAITEAGNDAWLKVLKKVNRILEIEN